MKLQRETMENWAKNNNVDLAQLRKQNADYDRLCTYLYNHDRNFRQYMGARNRAGKCGILQVSYTTYKMLRDTIMPGLEAKGYTPISVDNGIWFRVWGTGRGRDRKDHFEPVTTVGMMNGQRAEVIQTESWGPEVRKAYKESIPDLVEYRERYRLPPEAIRELVESDGSPTAVDAVWAKYKKTEAAATYSEESDEMPENFGAGGAAQMPETMPMIDLSGIGGATAPTTPPPSSGGPGTATVPPPVTSVVPPATVPFTPPPAAAPVNDQIATLMAQLAALQAAQAPQPTTAPPAATSQHIVIPTPVTNQPPAKVDEILNMSGAQLDALFSKK
jgi:hypothetical protein